MPLYSRPSALGQQQPLSISPFYTDERLLSGALLMVLRAQFVDRINQYTQVFRVDVGRNAMSQVEHVPWSFAVACERVSNALADDFR